MYCTLPKPARGVIPLRQAPQAVLQSPVARLSRARPAGRGARADTAHDQLARHALMDDVVVTLKSIERDARGLRPEAADSLSWLELDERADHVNRLLMQVITSLAEDARTDDASPP